MKIVNLVCEDCQTIHWSGGSRGTDEYDANKLTPCGCGCDTFIFGILLSKDDVPMKFNEEEMLELYIEGTLDNEHHYDCQCDTCQPSDFTTLDNQGNPIEFELSPFEEE